MRVFVKVCCNCGNGPQTYAIPCNEPTARVASLKSLALDRWSENCGDESKRDPVHFKLTLCGTGALLSDKDAIQDVLKDGEFVNLCESISQISCQVHLHFVAFYFRRMQVLRTLRRRRRARVASTNSLHTDCIPLCMCIYMLHYSFSYVMDFPIISLNRW